MKKIFKIISIIAITLISATTVFAEEKISVSLNENPLVFETPPEIINDTTMVPMRSIFEAMGYQIFWDESSQSVHGTNSNNTIEFKINSTTAFKGGVPYTLNAYPIIKNGYTLVPLRFIAESTDADVNWNPDTKTVDIFTKGFISNTNTLASVSNEELKKSVVQIITDTQQGSGVIISADGYIVTNFHVVHGAKTIGVLFNDGTTYQDTVTIAAYDTARDLVVLKINSTNLANATLGDSDNTKIGDSVVSIGSPGGVLNSVTSGSVKDITKYIIGSSSFIKGGSSGGGLFNSNGDVIGITSSYDTTKTYMAIPINFVKNMSLTQNIPLSQWQSVEHAATSPKDFSYYLDGDTAVISWDSVCGADYYHLYSSAYIDGNFTQVKTPDTSSKKWRWGFPYCFKLSSDKGNVFYFKIASVKDGVESPVSQVFTVQF